MPGEKVELSQAILEYLAGKVLADIRDDRAEQTLGAELCNALTTYRIVDRVREILAPGDFPYLRRLAESREPDICRIGITLLAPLMTAAPVRDYIVTMWQRTDLDFRTRMALQFRILDLPDLPTQMHQELFKFNLDNWDRWLAETQKWSGGAAHVVEHAAQRLNDARFPRGKRWIYILTLAAAEDVTAVRHVIDGLSQDGPMVEEAFAAVLAHLPDERP